MNCERYETFPVTFTAGDTLPSISAAQTDVNGSPENLTGYTITANLRQPNGTVRVLTITPVDLSVGTYTIDWVAGDLVEGRGQLVEIQYVEPGGGIFTPEKFMIDVIEELA